MKIKNPLSKWQIQNMQRYEPRRLYWYYKGYLKINGKYIWS